MSLFDVLRYPIDERYRLDDLQRIPWHILDAWWKEVAHRRGAEPAERFCGMSLYGQSIIEMEFYIHYHSAWPKYALEMLRLKIEEYEPI